MIDPDGSPVDGGREFGSERPEQDPRIQAGLDHLQRAAREVIAASRALLDAAEELVEDPKAAAGIADLVATVASRLPANPFSEVSDARRESGHDRGRSHPHADDDEPPVQRIPVS